MEQKVNFSGTCPVCNCGMAKGNKYCSLDCYKRENEN